LGFTGLKTPGRTGDPSDLDPDDLRDVAGPDLTDEDIQSILEFSEEYQGQYQSRVKNLEEKFTDTSTEDTSRSTKSVREKISESLSNTPRFEDRVEELLDVWEPDSIEDDDYEPDENDGFFSQCYTTRTEHRESLSLVPDLKTRLEEYDEHPWEVKRVSAASGNTSDESNGLSVSFHLDEGSKLNKWGIADYRGTGDKRDFSISTAIDDRTYSFEIEENLHQRFRHDHHL